MLPLSCILWSWKLLPIAIVLLVKESPVDCSQAMETHIELVGVGSSIGTVPLVQGLATLPDDHMHTQG